jgi:adenylosuccinate lyase
MGARLTDSAEYAHLWGTEEVRAIFDQDARRQAWIEILIALAEAQAELGIILRRRPRSPKGRAPTGSTSSCWRRDPPHLTRRWASSPR